MGRARLARLHGVSPSYEPAPGRRIDIAEDTVVAVLAALGVDASTPQAVRAALDAHDHARGGALLPPTLVVRPGRPLDLARLPADSVLQVETEGGATLEAPAGPGLGRPGAEPPGTGDLPPGVHLLRAHTPDGRSARSHLVVAPDRVPAPGGRFHGLMVQLYSLLSRRSWGMGDLADLAALAAWSGRELGSDFLQINPLHAAVPGPPTDPSPYRPSSRLFPDPVHLSVADVPEYARLDDDARRTAEDLLARAARLNETLLREGALIDRDAVWDLKRQALELLAAVPLPPERRAAFEAFTAERGRALEDHATWCALAEVHGPAWRSWPGALRDPRSAHTRRARSALADRVAFHTRLAWYTDEQLAGAQRAARQAGMAVGLVHDLAVGVHPSGADTWAQQDVFAAGMSVGAPPDAFNSRGQDWGLPPWRPDALARAGHAPFRDLLRGLLRHAGGLRVDHVMGLFRLWWVPEGRPPTEGCYVRYDAEAMLSLLALEAHRADAVVIGEDLGTVEPGVRETLAERGLLGTSVLWFERDWDAEAPADGGARGDAPALKAPRGDAPPPEAAAPSPPAPPLEPARWRADCLATATTHDLPTTAARLTGEHVALRHRLGLLDRPLARAQEEDAAERADWLALLVRLGLLPEGPDDEEGVVRAVHRFLLRTPARMVGIWLPDAVGDRRPQNVPGTWDQYPNWRLPISAPDGRPMTLEEITSSPRLHALLREFAPRDTSTAPVVPSPGAARGGRSGEPVPGTGG